MEKVSGTLSNVPAIANYESLKDKPQINNVELLGNKSLDDLGVASKEQLEKTNQQTTKALEEINTSMESLQKLTGELQKTVDSLIDGNEVAY